MKIVMLECLDRKIWLVSQWLVVSRQLVSQWSKYTELLGALFKSLICKEFGLSQHKLNSQRI